jgi:hypothetical protein
VQEYVGHNIGAILEYVFSNLGPIIEFLKRDFERFLNQIQNDGDQILAYIRENQEIGIIVLGAVTGAIVLMALTTPILAAIGFTATGPAAGSIAAAWEASLGNVAASSLFATLQSAQMGGYGSVIVQGAALGIGSGLGAAISGAIVATQSHIEETINPLLVDMQPHLSAAADLLATTKPHVDAAVDAAGKAFEAARPHLEATVSDVGKAANQHIEAFGETVAAATPRVGNAVGGAANAAMSWLDAIFKKDRGHEKTD